jgi:outer membrane protein insertion porin family
MESARLPNPPGPVFRPGWLAASVLIASLLCFSRAPAQQETAGFSYDGQPIAAVRLVASPTVNVQPFERFVKLKKDQLYSSAIAQATASALRAAGHFTRVDVQISPEADGLQVTFLLQPVYYVGIISFAGNVDGFDYSQLLNVVNFPANAPYEKALVNAGEGALKGFLANEGYFLARVHEETQLDNAHRLANPVYQITLGRRAKFGTVDVVGPPPPEAQRILAAIHSILARVRGGDIRTGKTYHPVEVQTATRLIRNYLGGQGWLAGQISIPTPRYDRKTNRVPIRFQIDLGPKVQIRVAGARVHGKTLKTLIPIYQENTFSDYMVTEGTHNLFTYLQSKGYFDAKVYPKLEKTRSLISLVYQVHQGNRHTVQKVSFAGNRHFGEDALNLQVVVQPAHFLSHGKFSRDLLNQSVTNLTAFYQDAGFEHVSVDPTVKDVEPKLYVTFHIKEGPQTIVNRVTVAGLKTQTLATVAPGGLNLRNGQPFSPDKASRDRKRIVASYLNLGYPDVSFRATSTPVPRQPHRIDIKYIVDEGPAVRIRSVVVLGEQHTKPAFILRNAGIQAGAPLSEGRMLGAESTLYNLGIFDWASVGPAHPIAENNQISASAEAPATLPLPDGNQMAAIEFIDPLEAVLIKVHESKRNALSYGVGFLSTPRTGQIATGILQLPGLPVIGLPSSYHLVEKYILSPEGSVEYSRKNFLGINETGSVSLVLSRLDQSATLSYLDPQFLGPAWSSVFSLSAERTTENPMFTAVFGQGSLTFDHLLNAAKTERLEFSYTYRQTDLSSLLIVNFVPTDDLFVRDSTVSSEFIRDTRDNPMNATRGSFETLQLSLTPKVIGSSDNFARLFGQAATYRKVKPWLVWASRIELGIESPFAGSQVPFSDRFFSGGDNSLRGFAIDSAGPDTTALLCTAVNVNCTAKVQVPTGGPQLLILNTEGRFPFPHLPIPYTQNLGGEVFYDGGNVFSSVGFNHFWSQYSNSVGGGLVYNSPVGPIRFDIGHNLHPPPGFNANQFYVTLGHAF